MNTSLLDQIFNTILNTTYTLQALNRRINLLQQIVEESLFKSGKINLTSLTNEQILGFANRESEILWIKSLDSSLSFDKNPKPRSLERGESSFLKLFTQDNCSTIFVDLKKLASSKKVLLLYLAVKLPDDEEKRIGVYLRQNYGKDFLFDTKLDPSLLGGCVLVWNGIYKDYSLKKTIEDNKQKILDEIQGFIKH